MKSIAEAFTEIVRLIGDTFRLWWKNFVPLTCWFLAGNVAFLSATQAAVWLRMHQHVTLAIGLFSLGALAQLVAIVGMIRTIAGSLYRWRDSAAETGGEAETIDPTQQRLLELLSLTLLPLIAVWSAWGYLDQAITEYSSTFYTINGVSEAPFKLGGGEWKSFIPAIIVLLVLRRIIEFFDDRWPNRGVKLFQVWIEAFFLLLVFVVSAPALNTIKNWFDDRRFWVGVTDGWNSVKGWFAGIKIPIPDGLEWLWGVFGETLWPLFKDGVAQPLTWLAITTVVFGHRTLSAEGVVRGTRFESRIGAGDASSRGRIASVAGRAPDLVLAGFKEKFLPTLNAFRLLLGVGPVFLGAVCVVYSMHDLARNWFDVAMSRWVGEQTTNAFTIMWGNMIALARDALFEPLRIALLAAAFDQAISVGVRKRRTGELRKAELERREPVRV